MREAIEAKVLGLLCAACAENGFGELVSLESSLGDLGIDSVKLVAMVFELEKSIGFEADEGQLAALKSVKDVVHMVESAMLARAS